MDQITVVDQESRNSHRKVLKAIHIKLKRATLNHNDGYQLPDLYMLLLHEEAWGGGTTDPSTISVQVMTDVIHSWMKMADSHWNIGDKHNILAVALMTISNNLVELEASWNPIICLMFPAKWNKSLCNTGLLIAHWRLVGTTLICSSYIVYTSRLWDSCSRAYWSRCTRR